MGYKNVSYLFAAVLLFAIIAFYPTYFGFFPLFEGTSWVIHFHVVVIVLWFIMLIVQPILIRKKRPDLHGLIGKLSYVIVPMVVLSLILVARKTQLRGKDLPIFAINIADSTMFIVYYGLAIFYRKHTVWHIRFMILTIIPFIDPAAARLHLPGLFLQVIIILILLLVERFNARIYKPYLIGLVSWFLIIVSLAYLVFFNQPVLETLWEVFF